jgi:recombination protein U
MSETISEKLVRIASVHYKKNKIADIEKVDARMRVVGKEYKRLIYSASSGLDFVGNCGGRFISFEVKETQRGDLPIDNIKTSQIAKMIQIREFGGISFLLVCFLDIHEWFTLGPGEINKAIELNAAYLQREYFIAFGKMVPLLFDFPDFLHVETHPLCDEMTKTFPKWLKHRRVQIQTISKPLEKIDPATYKDRVRAALEKGLKSAAVRDRKVFK